MEGTYVVNGNGNGNGNIHRPDVVNGNGNIHRHDVVVNLDRGDPKMYYPYWRKMDDQCSVTIKASELMSYFADVSPGGCFYQMPEFTTAVKNLHCLIGNAVVNDRYIIGGTGSSQLFTVALRAIASTVPPTDLPLPVVCAQPFYSCYQEALAEEKSEIYKWKGDAKLFNGDGAPYVEIVTSPNNPDGLTKNPVVKTEGGKIIGDLAYYWPQYTPITGPMNYDIMLFTLSKATGHAGSRVGWAIVKDKAIAENMIKQMSLMTIGTCREGQIRATKIMEFVANTYQQSPTVNGKVIRVSSSEEGLFEFGHRVLAERWAKLRAAVKRCGAFKLLEFPPQYCTFVGKDVCPSPAYAWIESKTGEDAEKALKELNIVTRNGPRFGAPGNFTRVSMLESDETFDLFIERLSAL